MVIGLLVGLAAGFVLSIPPGPIAVAVIKQAIDGRYRDALVMGSGAAMMDIIYMLGAAFASSAIITQVREMVTGSDWAMLLFQVVAIIVLIILGVRYFRATSADVAKTSESERQSEIRARRGGAGPYFVGIMIAVTNLASPTFLPSLVALATYLHAQGLLATSPYTSIFFAIGFGSGALVWFVVLTRGLYFLRSRIPARFISYIYRFAGGTFIVSAIILGINVALRTRWSQL